MYDNNYQGWQSSTPQKSALALCLPVLDLAVDFLYNVCKGLLTMYAIFQKDGQQYKAQENGTLRLQKLPAQVGEKVTFDEVLAVQQDGKLLVGTPYLEGARVTGTVLQHGRDRKIRVFKYKPKKHYKRQRGHRQAFTAVRIDEILL